MDFSVQYENINNTVVKVICSQTNIYYQKMILSQGSGVLIEGGKKILTCSHCIISKSVISIKTVNGNEYYANVIYDNPKIDIAVLELDNAIEKGAIFGNPNSLKIGQEVFAVGFPSHTKWISAMGANISGLDNGTIYIDASVNHGNSGGPLFNANAELIGIINSKTGNLSTFLNQIKDLQLPPIIRVGNIDPIQIIQQLISEMKTNLNLGMGTAIGIEQISKSCDVINTEE